MECFYAVTTGALSILVATLIGWQIYRTISFEKRLKKYTEDIAEQKAKEAGARAESLACVSMSHLFVNISVLYGKLESELVVDSLVNAIFMADRSGDLTTLYESMRVLKPNIIAATNIIKNKPDLRVTFTSIIYKYQGLDVNIDEIIQAYEKC